MFKHYFELIENVSIWPIISLSIFLGFFLILIIWLFKVDKGYINKMKNLPLDDKPKAKKGNSKLKIISCFLVAFSIPFSMFSQNGSGSGMDQETLVTWLVLIVVVIAILVLMVAIYTLSVLKLAFKKEETIVAKKESTWTKFWDRINKRVPKEKEASILMDHNYDGIRELDNHLPPWWTASFYLSMVFAVVYMFVYHVFDMAPLPGELYEIEIAEAKTAAAARLAEGGGDADGIDEATVTFSDDPAVIESGKKIYDMQCASCHRDDGGGNIGPNMTDAYWIHGGSMSDIFKIIKYGAPQKGMISWEALLSPTQMRDVSSYIMSLAGTDPPNAKGPQGDLYQGDAEAGSESEPETDSDPVEAVPAETTSG